MSNPLDAQGLFTTRHLVALHGVNRQRVSQICQAHPEIGFFVDGLKARLFTRRDLERFADARRGVKRYRPRKTIGKPVTGRGALAELPQPSDKIRMGYDFSELCCDVSREVVAIRREGVEISGRRRRVVESRGWNRR